VVWSCATGCRWRHQCTWICCVSCFTIFAAPPRCPLAHVLVMYEPKNHADIIYYPKTTLAVLNCDYSRNSNISLVPLSPCWRPVPAGGGCMCNSHICQTGVPCRHGQQANGGVCGGRLAAAPGVCNSTRACCHASLQHELGF